MEWWQLSLPTYNALDQRGMFWGIVLWMSGEMSGCCPRLQHNKCHAHIQTLSTVWLKLIVGFNTVQVLTRFRLYWNYVCTNFRCGLPHSSSSLSSCPHLYGTSLHLIANALYRCSHIFLKASCALLLVRVWVRVFVCVCVCTRASVRVYVKFRLCNFPFSPLMQLLTWSVTDHMSSSLTTYM